MVSCVKSLLAIGAVVLLATCAGVPTAPDNAPGSTQTYQPPEGKANIYIVRPFSFLGAVNLAQVFVDGKLLGSIGVGTYFVVAVDPGQHSVVATDPQWNAKVKLTAESGKNYFCSLAIGFSLDQLDEKAGEKTVNACTRDESIDE